MDTKSGNLEQFTSSNIFSFLRRLREAKKSTEQDVFVHASGLKEQISKNDSVQFEIIHGKKDKNLVEVTVV